MADHNHNSSSRGSNSSGFLGRALHTSGVHVGKANIKKITNKQDRMTKDLTLTSSSTGTGRDK